MRLRVGFFSFTCCEGCVVMFIELLNKKFSEYEKKLEIVNCRVLKTNEKIEKLDVAFVEGAISTPSEERKLKEIRAKSKYLVALGSGAVNGYPSNQRNSFSEEKKQEISLLIKKLNQLKEISPLKKFVRVNDKIEGCPVSEKDIEKMIDCYLNKFKIK